jgi:hypothetical protein
LTGLFVYGTILATSNCGVNRDSPPVKVPESLLTGKSVFQLFLWSNAIMPFTVDQLAYAGKASIDYYLKNDPIDQINVERPLIKKLMAGKSDYAGGLQYVVEQLRFSNDSNFQSYFGDGQVSYNRKRTLQQAKFSWGSFHDGFGLNEDELAQNGITMTDDRNSVPTDAEKVNLTNLLKENNETLKLGFQENSRLDVASRRLAEHDLTSLASTR